MNNAYNSTPSEKSQLKTPQQAGFALIASLSIMVLLVMITVGMLTLSTSEVRKSSQAKYQLEAQANARMALTIALGELQKYVGHDQRVTARADIHEKVSSDKRHLTGVWSTEKWDPRNPKQRELVAWLASVPVANQNSQTIEDVESPVTPFLTSNGSHVSEIITAVGNGSLGKDSDPSLDHVRVATIPVIADSGKQSGSYAYWVSDEASKASYGISEEESPKPWNQGSKLGTAVRTGVEALDPTAFADYENKMKSDPAAEISPSYQTFDNLFPATDKHSSKYFHALTNNTYSLMTNTRHGGLKSDLSTAFELDIKDFNAINEFHNSGEQNSTNNYAKFDASLASNDEFYPASHKLGYLFELDHNGTGMLRGPTWDLLRNHYRMYKRDWENVSWNRGFNTTDSNAFAARGYRPLSYSNNRDTSTSDDFATRSSPGAAYPATIYKKGNYDPSFDSIATPYKKGVFDSDTGTTRATAERISPMVVRMTYVLGFITVPDPKNASKETIAISVDPYVTLVNPYNRPIEFESIGTFTSKMRPLLFFYDIEYADGKAPKNPIKYPLYFSKNWFSQGSIAYRLPLGKYRMEPGEVKVMSPETDSPTDYANNYLDSRSDPNLVEASFDYAEDSRLYIIPCNNGGAPQRIQPSDINSISIAVCGKYKGMKYGKTRGDRTIVTQHYSKSHDGSAVDQIDHIPGANGEKIQVNADVFDDPVITEISYSTFSEDASFNPTTFAEAKDHDLSVSDKFTSFRAVGQAGEFFAAFDIKMKHGMEDTPVFHQFSPRAQVYDPRNYQSSDRLGAAWKVELKKITSIADLSLIDGDGHGRWGAGYDSTTGQSKVVLYDLPWAPSTSLASLSSADISVLPSGGSNAIGNSFTNPAIEDLTQLTYQATSASSDLHTDAISQPQADFSWASNEALWDQYFYSSMNWGDSKLAYDGSAQTYKTQDEAVDKFINSTQLDSPLVNPRIHFMEGFASGDPKVDLKDYDKVAKHIAVAGGFNVNSTSEEAWRAVLGSLRNKKITHVSDSGSLKETQTNVPFSRLQLPAAEANKAIDDDEFSGYCDLTDDQITELAKAIVEQVKARGPFMGMSDFVNRRLTKDSESGVDFGKLGALQAAIESTDINDALRNTVTAANIHNTTIGVGEKSVNLSTMTGAPGYLMQADILNSLGSILRTRSDTFLVRAYGDARDKSGKIVASAWCEARIQRTPEWVEQTEEPFKNLNESYPDYAPNKFGIRWKDNPAFPATSNIFGRKMKVVSFRWLSKDEI